MPVYPGKQRGRGPHSFGIVLQTRSTGKHDIPSVLPQLRREATPLDTQRQRYSHAAHRNDCVLTRPSESEEHPGRIQGSGRVRQHPAGVRPVELSVRTSHASSAFAEAYRYSRHERKAHRHATEHADRSARTADHRDLRHRGVIATIAVLTCPPL